MSKSISMGLAGALGIGAPVTITSFYQSQSTIWDVLSEDVVPDNNDESLNSVWEALKTSLSSKDDLQNPKLQEIKAKKNDDLKAWCFQSYKAIYWNWFRKENLSLKSDVEKACIQTIEAQLGNSKIDFSSEDAEANKTNFNEEKMTKFRNHKESDGKLDNSLIKVKNSTDTANQWKGLRDWCKSTYKRGFQGNGSNRWKIVQLYCKTP